MAFFTVDSGLLKFLLTEYDFHSWPCTNSVLLLKGSDNSVLHLGLLSFWSLSIVEYYMRNSVLEIIYLCPQVKVGEAQTQFGL
jgi:hypothetical protein